MAVDATQTRHTAKLLNDINGGVYLYYPVAA
jgi:hypothetical protein